VLTLPRVILALRLTLVALFFLLLVLQLFSFPGQFAYMARQEPDGAYLRWPLTLLVGFWLLCTQVVVVSVWKLLSLTKDDRILTRASVPWVNMIIGAIAAAALGVIGALGALLTRADDPGLPLLMFIVIVALTALALFVYVLRHVLLRAITLRRDDAQSL
jgi:hypothetical protein